MVLFFYEREKKKRGKVSRGREVEVEKKKKTEKKPLLTGMMHTFLCESPLALWKALIAMSPAYSPEAPELGWRDTASKPVISASCVARCSNISA